MKLLMVICSFGAYFTFYGLIILPGWAIGKYYTADLSIWTAHLDEEFSFRSLPISKQLDALVMVFDMNDVRNTIYAF